MRLERPLESCSHLGPDAWAITQRRRDTARLEALAQRPDVPVHERRNVGIYDRGARSLVLAYLRQHVDRCADVEPGELLPDELGDPLLMLAVPVRVEQADRDRFHFLLADSDQRGS